MKNNILRFLIITILFYFLVYLYPYFIGGSNPRENWNGLMISVSLTYAIIPLFTIIIGIICVVKNCNLSFLILLAFVNTILCGFVLYLIFHVNGISPKTSGVWYFEYSLFILVLLIVSCFAANGIKKVIASR